MSLLSDFPRLDQWSENTLSDASLFMDGFLYISSGPAKTTLDRRGKDGERRQKTQTISVFVSHLNGMFCQRSNSVKHRSINQSHSVSCQTANRWIRKPNSPVKKIKGSVFQMGSAALPWELLSGGRLADDPVLNGSWECRLNWGQAKRKSEFKVVGGSFRDDFAPSRSEMWLQNCLSFVFRGGLKLLIRPRFTVSCSGCCRTSCSVAVQTAGAFPGPVGN